MRTFVAIDLDEDIREKISRFQEGVSGFAPNARWVRPESLHITLKFIGEQKEEQVAAVREALQHIDGSNVEIRLRDYGFFPTAKAPRVFWIGIEAAPQLAELAARIDAALSELNIASEERAFSPHLTLARAGSASPKWKKGDGPNSTFTTLQDRLTAMSKLDFGAVTARDFFLYRSELSPKGAKYTKLQSFPLR